MVSQDKLSELRRNYDVFLQALSTLLNDHAGQFVLMRHGEFVAYYDTARDALLSGRSAYDDDLFSVQEVTGARADFGWYSRAPANTPL